jgi:hypothetical protein
MNRFSPIETLGLAVTAVLTLGIANARLSRWRFTQWITLNSFVVSVLSFGAIGDGRLQWLRIFL